MTTSDVRTVRDATFDVLRNRALTRIFANPGSTEIQLLANFPGDFDFTLALHEGSVVGMATGYALARREAAMVIVHTTAGLGNAIGAIATARVNRAPLVILVGQQDRRHLASDPFLAGRIRGLAGEYPVWYNEPVTAQDVPAALARAHHEATTKRGPAIVVVPMDDWRVPVDEAHVFTAAARVERTARPSEAAVTELALALNEAKNPVIISGAGNDSSDGWVAAVALAEKIQTPVLHESFAGGAGFPQNHPLFAGFLSASRSSVRNQLAEFDLILSVGAPVFRQYSFEPGEMFAPGTRVFVVTPDSDEAHRSPAELAILADIAPTLRAVAELVSPRDTLRTGIEFKRRTLTPPTAGEPLRASQVMAALAELVSDDVILVEETPSSRPDLHDLLPAKQPLGFVSAAMGGLGFGLPAAIGLRMGSTRPVVAILGDGSSMYGIQGLWSAAKYEVGTLFIILNNGRYAVMDRLDEKFGTGSPAWPAFDEIDFVELSRSLGCPAERLTNLDDVRSTLADVIPTLAERTGPLVLVIDVEPELTFAP